LQVEFSPPEKIKSEPDDVTDSIVNYRMVLAPFQKQTQVEFTNIKLKETSVRFLTVVNPLDKPGQVKKFIYFYIHISLLLKIYTFYLYIFSMFYPHQVMVYTLMFTNLP